MTEQLDHMHAPAGSCDSGTCPEHYHADDPIFTNSEARQRLQPRPLEQVSASTTGQASDTTLANEKPETDKRPADVELDCDPEKHGFRRIIRNFTPSYV
jgi:hypothetical protein